MRGCGGIIPPQGVRGCYTLARCHSLIKQAEPQNDRRVPVVLSCKVTCSFCSSWRRRRSWRLSPACPLSPWSFRLPRKPVCRLLWIRCFPCSLLWGIAPVFRLLPVEGSMSLRSWFYTSPAGVFPPYPPCGGIIPPHPHARGSSPRAPFRRQTFISAAPAMKRRLHSSCSACKHAHRTSS